MILISKHNGYWKRLLVLSTLFAMAAFHTCVAQKVTNVRASLVDKKVVIDYDLISPDPYQNFTIDVFCSYEPDRKLSGLSGDIGKNMLPGLNRQVIWDVNKDYKEIIADVSFRVVATYESLEGLTTSSDNFVVYAEYPAVPIGGYPEFYSNISKRIRYPRSAMNSGLEGKVMLQFIVELDGSLSNFNVVKDIGQGCGEAAIKAVKNSEWKPAEHKGKRVRQQVIIPVTFKMEDSRDEVDVAFSPIKSNNSDKDESSSEVEEILMNPDQKAKPRGGFEALFSFIAARINRPFSYEESSAKTVIQLTVEKNGKVSGIVFIKGTNKKIEDQIVKLIKNFKWDPAIHGGVKVRNQITFPLNLRFN